jgi:hypothetical protein
VRTHRLCRYQSSSARLKLSQKAVLRWNYC